MSTDALKWIARQDIDSPWVRLYWTLPAALLICAIASAMFVYSLEHSTPRTPEPIPVDAELIELPAPSILQQYSPPDTHVQAQPIPIKQNVQSSPSPAQTPAVPTPPPANPVSTQTTSNPKPVIASQSAQPISQPLPVIPDDLREEAMNEAATVRFHIAEDGSVTVDLIKPTQNPRLNRLLLDSLKHWKFNPAIKEGQPVPSVEVIVVRVLVN